MISSSNTHSHVLNIHSHLCVVFKETLQGRLSRPWTGSVCHTDAASTRGGSKNQPGRVSAQRKFWLQNRVRWDVLCSWGVEPDIQISAKEKIMLSCSQHAAASSEVVVVSQRDVDLKTVTCRWSRDGEPPETFSPNCNSRIHLPAVRRRFLLDLPDRLETNLHQDANNRTLFQLKFYFWQLVKRP